MRRTLVVFSNGSGDSRARCQQQRANAQQRDGFNERPQGRLAGIRRDSSWPEEGAQGDCTKGTCDTSGASSY
eukprot:6189521-Pleurochrysis_carterae.AAC.2